jgi:hypothetical protein
MSEKPKVNAFETNKAIDDNARKFISEPIDRSFLQDHHAKSFTLTTDWLETSEESEKKIAYKEYDNGDIQILLISKHTTDGKRSTVKEKITGEEYNTLLGSSILRVEKRRHEFEYIQNDIAFSVNFDEFTAAGLNVVEIDASKDEERNIFDPSDFPAKLAEVTGDMSYYGYRIAHIL